MKENKLTVATIFSDMENIHLIKDPGMIPFTLHKYYGFNAIVPLSSQHDYPYKDKFFSDIETPILDDMKSRNGKYYVRLKWLIKNANNIDLLHLYFFERWTWVFIFAYKLLNKKGLVYVHVDTDGSRLLNYKFTDNVLKKLVMKRVLLSKKNLYATLWGIQNSTNVKKIKGVWPFINAGFVPNGFFWEENSKPEYEKKENIILTVARLGTPPKKTDLLLEAFARVAPEFPEWKLRLVGSIEESFKDYIENFFARNPELKDRVEFVGPIYDRVQLEQEYTKAKIFCLPSAWESFGLASIEALSKGCFLLESDIDSNIEVTQNGKMGVLFENGNLDDFVEKMKSTLSDESRLKSNFPVAVEYANTHFSWEKALEPVEKWIEEKRGTAK